MESKGSNPDLFTKRKAILLAFELGYIIAIPIVVFGLIGKNLDIRLGTDPWLKIAGLLLAITTTTVWISRRFAEIFKAMKKDSSSAKTTEDREKTDSNSNLKS